MAVPWVRGGVSLGCLFCCSLLTSFPGGIRLKNAQGSTREFSRVTEERLSCCEANRNEPRITRIATDERFKSQILSLLLGMPDIRGCPTTFVVSRSPTRSAYRSLFRLNEKGICETPFGV
jgi:hypothetical protein